MSPRPHGFPVLHEDEHLLVLDKPGGEPTVPDASGDRSIHERVQRSRPGREAFVGVVHRLDRPVSGVLALALTSDAAAALTEQFRERTARKTYLAVAEGFPRDEEGTLTQWLLKDGDRNIVRSVAPERRGARKAITRWRVLMTLGERSLLELKPETGRSHQLRVAASKLGCPLVGDVKYGASKYLKDKTIGLHARDLRLRHPADGRPLELQAPLREVPLWNLARRWLESEAEG
jgi:23S rRNA pseudouridine1911/1915/1917 synthase